MKTTLRRLPGFLDATVAAIGLCCFTVAIAQTATLPLPDDSLTSFFSAFRGKPVADVPPVTLPPVSNNTPAVGGSGAGDATGRQIASVPPVMPPSACPPGYQRDPTGCVTPAMPMHAHRQGAEGGWTCDFGYARTGDVCTVLATPPNAHLANTATGWECDRGYHLAGQRCAPVFIPFNAHLSADGGHYECNYGYRDIGMSCSP